MRLLCRRFCYAMAMALASLPGIGLAASDESQEEDGWINVRDEQTGILVRTRELTLHPRAEPRPSLKYRLLPDEFEMLEGNAAIYYLKAMGFLEQGHARAQLREIRIKAAAHAREKGVDYSDVPPEVWRSTSPDKLPVDDVKKHLQWTRFQPPFLKEASRRRQFNVDRNLRDVNDPIAYLLPEIQSLRELARTQSLRCRVAIAEERINDAIAILGQQYAMARHLGQDEFLVSNLVGIACAGIAWTDALYLVEHPKAPNLYWAYASMPQPLVSNRKSMAIERQLLYEQIKVLREVDETPRPAGYWQDFLDRLVPQVGTLAREFRRSGISDDPELTRAVLVGYVAAAYPGAREYLIKECRLPPDQVESYPTAQVVFLAMVRYYDYWRDEFFKWTYVPFWQAESNRAGRGVDSAMIAAGDHVGWCAAPAHLLLPAVLAARTATARNEQMIALIQTVEAIRMYGAAHDRKLPTTLDELPVPIPVEPFTGQPIKYQHLGSKAILDGHRMPGMRYRLIVRFAK